MKTQAQRVVKALAFDLGPDESIDTVDQQATTITAMSFVNNSGLAMFTATPTLSFNEDPSTSVGTMDLEFTPAQDEYGTATLTIELVDTAANGSYRGSTGSVTTRSG